MQRDVRGVGRGGGGERRRGKFNAKFFLCPPPAPKRWAFSTHRSIERRQRSGVLLPNIVPLKIQQQFVVGLSWIVDGMLIAPTTLATPHKASRALHPVTSAPAVKLQCENGSGLAVSYGFRKTPDPFRSSAVATTSRSSSITSTASSGQPSARARSTRRIAAPWTRCSKKPASLSTARRRRKPALQMQRLYLVSHHDSPTLLHRFLN